ncbi:MAG: hypothetical protein V2J42_12770 [Wenzhouxiangella sp.]|nr:hypothetical protein [Wenzhouxiangella sp.]
MRKTTLTILLTAVLALFCLGALTGCEDPGPAEQAGQEVDEAIEEAGDNLEELGDEAEEELDEVEEEVG